MKVLDQQFGDHECPLLRWEAACCQQGSATLAHQAEQGTRYDPRARVERLSGQAQHRPLASHDDSTILSVV